VSAADELARSCADAILARDTFARQLGVEILEVGTGHAVARLRTGDGMVNGIGTVHGAVVFALADIAYAIACNSHGMATVSRSAEVIHTAPAHPGDVLLATAAERTRIGRNGVYDVTVRREDGAVVAEFRGQSRSLGGALVTDPENGAA
jgi:acyl-CoA thioesterase